MKRLSTLREQLGLKLFLSYLVIILVGVVVLAGTAEFHASTALARHTARMEALIGANPDLVADLHENFRTAVNEILVIAALAASLAALITSSFVARRIVGPIQAMMKVSQRIAAGDYHERVQVPSEDELGALARAFNQMAETLEQTEERRQALIGDVAHELRTPLSSITGIMEGLVDGVLPAEPVAFLGVQREVARLQRLVHDLEELSRAEAGQIPLDPRPVAPAGLIRAAADRLRPQFEDKEVSLHLDLPADLPQVRVDPGRITQVLLNLLGNALQYTPPGGRVTVSAKVSGRRGEGEIGRGGDKETRVSRALTHAQGPLVPSFPCLLVMVQDTGIGIPAEHLPHVFERFYRVDKSRSRAGGGSGIGLTIARHLVEAHGGRIWAESPGPGQGSTFTFTLPLAS